VDVFGPLEPFEWVNGPAGQELGTGSGRPARRLPPVDFELGVIAGNRSLNPSIPSLIPGADDGKVAVERTMVEGMDDFIILPVTHTFMMNNPVVIAEVVEFLRDGAFDHDMELMDAVEEFIELPRRCPRCRTGRARRSGRTGDPVHMAHLAARAGLGLAVEMHLHAAFGGERGRAGDVVADQVFHHHIRVPRAVAQRPAGDGADVLLELVDGAARLRPVAGIVHAGRDLVHDEAPGRDEELHAEDADVIERVQDARGDEDGVGSQARGDRAGTVVVARMPFSWTFSPGS
jgi:hypothetical protein